MSHILILITICFFTAIAPDHANATIDGAYSGALERADELYSQRDYSPDGIKNARNAAFHYGTVATKLMSHDEGQFAVARQLRANYFVGMASSNGKNQIFMEGFSIGMRALLYFERTYGRDIARNSSVPARTKKIYAEVVINYARNVREWVRTGGSSNEWTKAKALLDNVRSMNQESMCEYGALQILATDAMENNSSQALGLFEQAYRSTQLRGTGPSVNGWINYNYANLLAKSGDKTKAISILKEFSTLPAEEFSVDFIPENRVIQKMALDLLKQWGV